MFGLGQRKLYQQVYADDTLTEAWRKVRTGTELAGVDGVTVAQFQARLFTNLKTLQTDLKHQRYVTQPVKRFALPKADGTKRPIGILTVPDRIAQRAVLLVITPIFEAVFEECSHGFRKERSVATALGPR
jgi:RNA-directed DNA polymerase